jgi:NMD protein affecting ribosome stability and mRNA decay
MFDCPQCGGETETLYEGVCEDCRVDNQRRLNEHNASYDFWQKCTDAEKDFYIRSAMK